MSGVRFAPGQGRWDSVLSEHKSTPGYLDVAANTHGQEKAFLIHRALQRLRAQHVNVVEIGPGGGAAVADLASRLVGDPQQGRRSGRAQGREVRPRVDLTLIEAPGITSCSLTEAMSAFRQVGSCELVTGFAQDLATVVTKPAHVISASALLHEVYSYGGGYDGLRSMIRTLPSVLSPGGMFAYRDVYAVEAPSLHQRAVQTYQGRSWLTFMRMFLPPYLREGTHPYHRADDEVVCRQDSQIVAAEALNHRVSAVISAPVGIFRELQRHYLTLRDHVWRSGVLGFQPFLDGQYSADWVDARTGHKRIHYTLTPDTQRLPTARRAMLEALSEPYTDHHSVDGDLFDAVTDLALAEFLTLAEQGHTPHAQVWQAWALREGRETYAYLTLSELLATFVASSTEAPTGATALMPVRVGDVIERDRAYYNRYLSRTLPNPLTDAKQLVLFTNLSLAHTRAVEASTRSLQRWCSRASLTRIYTALTSRGRHAA